MVAALHHQILDCPTKEMDTSRDSAVLVYLQLTAKEHATFESNRTSAEMTLESPNMRVKC